MQTNAESIEMFILMTASFLTFACYIKLALKDE